MSRKAQKLWERAQNTKAGWKAKDLVTLYEGFGFRIRKGKGSHRVVSHPDYDDLDAVLTIHGNKELGKAYVEDAISLIKELLRRQAEEKEDEEND